MINDLRIHLNEQRKKILKFLKLVTLGQEKLKVKTGKKQVDKGKEEVRMRQGCKNDGRGGTYLLGPDQQQQTQAQ